MAQTTYESPLGPLTLIGGLAGLRAVRFPDRSPSVAPSDRDPAALDEVIGQLEQYFTGERQAFSLELDLPGTAFQQQVWRALQRLSPLRAPFPRPARSRGDRSHADADRRAVPSRDRRRRLADRISRRPAEQATTPGLRSLRRRDPTPYATTHASSSSCSESLLNTHGPQTAPPIRPITRAPRTEDRGSAAPQPDSPRRTPPNERTRAQKRLDLTARHRARKRILIRTERPPACGVSRSPLRSGIVGGYEQAHRSSRAASANDRRRERRGVQSLVSAGARR